MARIFESEKERRVKCLWLTPDLMLRVLLSPVRLGRDPRAQNRRFAKAMGVSVEELVGERKKG